MGSKLGRLQGKLDLSVPMDDFSALRIELESLREEHLEALKREVDAKITALGAQEQARELRLLKVSHTTFLTYSFPRLAFMCIVLFSFRQRLRRLKQKHWV